MTEIQYAEALRFRQGSRQRPCSVEAGLGIGAASEGEIDAVHWMRLSGRFGAD